MSTELRVCSFNVRRGKGDDGTNNWTYRQRLLVETIREIDPDVIGLQEPLPHQYSYLRDQLDAFDWYGVPRQGNREGELVPVGWRTERFDARKCETRWSSETPMRPSTSWNANWPRPVTNIQLLDWHQDGAEIGVWNTHFDTGETRRRVKSAEQLRGWVGDGEPCIVMGDFNARIEDEPIRALIGDGTLRDARDIADDCVGPLPTSHDFEGNHHNCIDHVFVSPDVDVTRFETVAKSEDGKYPSDHFPVVADAAFESS
jgi:endonuclease/exonuclease/phosphatase family metal-dependent hydrolase